MLRKWLPQGDCFVGDEVLQVVTPSPVRQTVLEVAHDGVAGH